jgi:ADP-L-glycero-D-manno-heptose 6-epimerase
MIVITGAAGFIGSCLAAFFEKHSDKEIVLVDDFSNRAKSENLIRIDFLERVERTEFFKWAQHKKIDWIYHIGARTDTTEFDYSIFEELNVAYSKRIWQLAIEKNAGLVYASSAATYGDGCFGYKDDHDIISRLEPLNPYGVSKNEFDKWALVQSTKPIAWYGLKFFNVYGPNENHKGRMASVIFHAFHQIQKSGSMKLFRSHNPEYKDGMQLRDFVYVKDICSVIEFLSQNSPANGIYNLGTGKARTFYDLAKNVFEALNKEIDIQFIDTPNDIRDKYQYFTEAKMGKLRSAGYHKEFTSLEAGIRDYVQNYLVTGRNY